MNRKLTTEQRVFVLQTWWKHDHNYSDVCDLFVERFPNIEPPSRQCIRKLNLRFEQTGSVAELSRSGRPRSVTSEENLNVIAQCFVQSPTKSQRKASNEYGIARTSLRRIQKQLHLRPYRPTLLQGLNEDDPDRRVEFCELYTIRQEADPNFYKSILWSDEATFKVNGRVNRHNCVYWDSTNPHVTMETELNTPGVSVWAGIFSGGLIRPYFFDGTVNSLNYLDMLQEVLLELENSPLYEHLQPAKEQFIWQQDGAPPHYGLIVRDFLNENFNEWIGRRGTIEWPPRSPDITPMDFSVWGILKNEVYSVKIRNVEHLKERIQSEFENLQSRKICDKICESVLKRCNFCLEQHGGHFEHLL
uniref:DUF4817 domain-containing protein n=1 Tax=Graphocephala atropunctata TaxID=36148 RepID=A0A1B6L4Y9_9HEMI